VLPTPHGPTDAPLPESTQDATVGTGRTPDEVALLRVVEHLADVPDGEGEDVDATDDAAADDTPGDDTADEAPGDDDAPRDEAPAAAVDEPAAPEPVPAPAVAVEEVGPVAAALSDTRHRIDELNPTERIFLAQQRALIVGLCPDPGDAEAVGALFDRVRQQWIDAEDRPDPRPLADAFGVALGDLVCAQAPDLTWATCSDRYGTEIVLARVDPEVLVYPIAAVGQYWETAAPGWFLTHLASVVHGVVPDLAPTDA